MFIENNAERSLLLKTLVQIWVSLFIKCAGQRILICPPHLHNLAALPWETLIFSFQRLKRRFPR